MAHIEVSTQSSRATQPLIDLFHALVSIPIDAEGVYPFPAVARGSDGDAILALAVTPDLAMRTMVHKVQSGKFDEIIVGLDRYTKPGQDAELGDLVSAYHWRRDRGWRCGIIEYQHEPRIVRPWNWDSFFWSGVMARELAQLGVPDVAMAH